MSIIKKNLACRACGSSKLEEFLSLGKTPPANAFLKKKDFNKERSFPLRLGVCRSCKLVQLLDVVSKEHLFSHYVYFFSAMPTASNHFGVYAQDIAKRFIKNQASDLIVELGSNDGLLLKSFQESGCQRVLGIDPAKNIAKFANEQGVPTLAHFFSHKLASKVSRTEGKAQVIIGNNVVAHIDDWQDLAKGVDELLAQDGVFIFEAPYLMDMFENLAYDSIYHEHLSYLSVAPLVRFFKKYRMNVFDVQPSQRQGNSIRVFVSRLGEYKILPSVKKFLDKEKRAGLGRLSSYHALAKRIQASRNQLVATIQDLKNKKMRIAAYGAPARGNTLLNYGNIGPKLIDFATEELPLKIGLYSPGMHIPVKHIEDARKNHPDYYLLLAWNYKDQILKKEPEFIKQGGKFIVPVGDKVELI